MRDEKDNTELNCWDPPMAFSVLKQLIQHFGQLNSLFVNFVQQEGKKILVGCSLWFAKGIPNCNALVSKFYEEITKNSSFPWKRNDQINPSKVAIVGLFLLRRCSSCPSSKFGLI